MSDKIEEQEKEFIVVAYKTVTKRFSVYADDEEDARFQVENPGPGDFGFDDGEDVDQEDWNVTDIEEALVVKFRFNRETGKAERIQ